MTCLNFKIFVESPIRQNIAANMYEIATANKVPRGPSQIPIIATNLESPLPNASFLNIFLARYLKDSQIKKETTDVTNPLKIKYEPIFVLFNKSTKTKPKIPEKKPKFINPWGIQKLSISISDIQIKIDRKIQLKICLKIKLASRS